VQAGARGLVVAVLALVLASCGVSADGDPQVIAPERLPPDLLDPNPSTTTTLSPTQTVPVTVYLLRQSSEGTVVVPVEREVTNATEPGQRIAALLDAQPTAAEQARGLSSAIPPDVELLEAALNRDDRVLSIDLSGEFFAIQGPLLSNAFAQIVYTAAELDGVRTIRFRVDGRPQQAIDADGAQQNSVDTSDYRALAPR
jgi:spore germination protein GerM